MFVQSGILGLFIFFSYELNGESVCSGYVHCVLCVVCCVFFGGRGFPVWLKYVHGITFRTDNEPFKVRLMCLI